MKFARLMILSVLLVSVATGCSSPSPKAPSGEKASRTPDQILEGFTMIITDRGVEKSRFNALRAMVFNDENLVEAEDIHVEFFRSNGELYSTLRADRGTLNTETKDMDARNHVVVISHDNIRLETESLHWNESANLITTEDPVTLVQGGKKIRGIGMTSDPGLNDVKIRRPTGVFRDIEAPDEE